jgi:hypothetical protein
MGAESGEKSPSPKSAAAGEKEAFLALISKFSTLSPSIFLP